MFKSIKFYLVTVALLVSGVVTAGLISRFTTFTDGQILTAAQLNGEFNQLVNLVNGSLDNDNLSTSAAIAPSKISASIAGDGLSSTAGVLSVNVDDVTLDTSADAVIVKTNGVGNAQLRQSAALSVMGNSTNATANVADITAASDGLVLRRSGTSVGFGQIATAGIADDAVTQEKLGAINSSTSSSSGAFSTTSTSLTTVTNLSVSLTTTGRPVMVMMTTADTAGTCTGNCEKGSVVPNDSDSAAKATVAFLNGAGVIASWNVGGSTGGATSFIMNYPCSSFHFIDVQSAGTFTYTVQVAASTGDALRVDTCKLIAYEL